MNANKIISISSIMINTKIISISIKHCFFFILSADQLLEMFPRYNGPPTISESFCFKFVNFCTIEEKNDFLLHCNVSSNRISFFVNSVINQIHFSRVKVWSNLCVGLFPRTNMSFYLLSMLVEKLISTPKTNIF